MPPNDQSPPARRAPRPHVGAAGATPRDPVGIPTGDIAPPVDQRDDSLSADWPCEGYAGPQPWEVKNPPETTHGRGTLSVGEAGERVRELANCLGWLGISCSVTEGKNPHLEFDQSVKAAVEQFRSLYNVKEEPTVIQATNRSVVGPWTWEALFRAVEAAKAAA